MFTMTRIPSRAVALLALAPLTLACGAQDEATGPVGQAEGAAFVDTSALPLPPFGSHFTTYTMCWDASAVPTGAAKPLFDAGRAAVQQEITSTWDVNSWVDFVWRANCNSGGIPIQIVEGRPNGGRTQITLNFRYATYRTAECAPAGNTPTAAWTNCVKKNAVHEFGHLLGFDHEQNRNVSGQQCAAGDVVEADNGDFSITGDLPLGPSDANSVMSYCWNNRTANLSNFDVTAVQTIYGAEGRSVADGKFYAVRVGQKFMDVNGQSDQVTTTRIERALRLKGPTAGAAIRYGDKVNVLFGSTKLCSTLGWGSRFLTTQPKLVFTSTPYDPGACIWEVQHDSSGDGGNTVNVNDSVNLRLDAPAPPQMPGQDATPIPYRNALGIHFLGDIPPA